MTNRDNQAYRKNVSPVRVFDIDLDVAGGTVLRLPVVGNSVFIDASGGGYAKLSFNTCNSSADEYISVFDGFFCETQFESISVLAPRQANKSIRIIVGNDFRAGSTSRRKTELHRQGSSSVSGTIAGLAPSATTTVILDLGERWFDADIVQVFVRSRGPSSGLSNVGVYSSEIASLLVASILLPYAFSNTSSSAFVASIPTGNGVGISVRPCERYIVVSATNADAVNAQGADSHMDFSVHFK